MMNLSKRYGETISQIGQPADSSQKVKSYNHNTIIPHQSGTSLFDLVILCDSDDVATSCVVAAASGDRGGEVIEMRLRERI